MTRPPSMPFLWIAVWSAPLLSCKAAPTDHLGGISPEQLLGVATEAGFTCATHDVAGKTDTYTTRCGTPDGDSLNGSLRFGGSTTAATVSFITATAPAFVSPDAELNLAYAVAELEYDGCHVHALKSWIRAQAAGTTTTLSRDFGPVTATFASSGNVLILESMGRSD